jgi:hypothetical protein
MDFHSLLLFINIQIFEENFFHIFKGSIGWPCYHFAVESAHQMDILVSSVYIPTVSVV